MRIVMVIPSLQPGGAERVLSIMANHWAAADRQITVLSFAPPESRPFFSLLPTIQYRRLDLEKESSSLPSAVINNLRRAGVLRRALKAAQPDLVVSFLTETNVITLLSARFLGVPVIVAEHTDPRRCPLAAPWAVLRTLAYRWAHRVVVLTRDAKSFFGRGLQARISIIPNPVAPAANERQTEREKVVLAVGRLGDEKGYDVLLRAFSRVAQEMTDWRLELVGDGPRRESLEGLARDLGIAGRMRFLGVLPELERVYRRASVYALSSRYEGFPMALCEAMANGCAVVATEYSAGVFDLIDPGGNGLVVPPEDVEALADALWTLMSDAPQRAALGSAAKEIANIYGVPKIMAMWEDLMPLSVYGDKPACSKH